MAPRRLAKLVAKDSSSPAEFTIKFRESIIGAAPGSDLLISDPSVSRRHARLTHAGQRFELTDLDSTNGTYVNGRRIDCTVVLEDGASISFGRSEFLVRITKAPAAGLFKWATSAAVALLIAAGVTDALINLNRIVASEVPAPAKPPPISAPSRATPSLASPQPSAAVAKEFHATSKPMPVATAIRSGDSRLRDAVAAADRTSIAPVASPAEIMPPSSADNYVSPAVMGWLGQLNFYRVLAGVPAVEPDSRASRGDEAHARYVLKNYATMLKSGVNPGAAAHQEDVANKWYTPEGSRAGIGSDMDFSTIPPGSEGAFPAHALEAWLRGPFHRFWLLNPYLRTVGYGQSCVSGFCVAAMDVLSGAIHPSHDPAPLPTPIEFPPSGSVLSLDRLSSEWPDPLTACPRYSRPAGMPITLQCGAYVATKLSSYSLSKIARTPTALEACGFDAASYTNSDASAQSKAREALQLFGAVVIVPRRPLAPGTYKVSITAAGHAYEWSFTINRPY